MKRAFDIVAAAVGLVILSPAFAIVALVITLYSPGPVFYRALRVGRDERQFRLYKFRTMVVNADKIGSAITTAGDQRVTPIGRTLRSTKLDELPQLINVLYGEMSIVGPRPESPHYVALYTTEQREILRYRPGITSPASLRFRDEESLLVGDDWEAFYIHTLMPQKLALDLDYMRHATVLDDIYLILKTVAHVLPFGRIATK